MKNKSTSINIAFHSVCIIFFFLIGLPSDPHTKPPDLQIWPLCFSRVAHAARFDKLVPQEELQLLWVDFPATPFSDLMRLLFSERNNASTAKRDSIPRA
jgi:hypothetical protein